MDALGYLPPRSAADKGARPVVAMVLCSQTNPYHAAMCEAAMLEAHRSGYRLHVYTYPDNALCGDVATDLIAHHPAGALLAGPIVEKSPPEELHTALTRLQRVMPVVAIGPPVEGLECTGLRSDPSQSVRKGIAHLAMLGHRRIAFIGGDPPSRFSRIRESTFREEMERLGCVLQPEHIVITGLTPEAGEVAVNVLMNTSPAIGRPTAIYAINDLVALGAMRQLQRMGLRIPEDMAIVGCDNSFFAPYLHPPLTTIDLRPADHGRIAMAELLAAIGGSNTLSFSQNCEASLIVRESCGAALGQRTFPDAPMRELSLSRP